MTWLSIRKQVVFALYFICLAIHSPAAPFFVPSSFTAEQHALPSSLTENHGRTKAMEGKRRFIVRGGHQSSPQPPAKHNAHVTNNHMSSTPQGETSSPSKTTSDGHSWPYYLVASFIRLLFKGMTLPFPMLRELGNVDNGMGFSIRQCLVAIASYLCLGTLSYSVIFEKWSLVDSLYFSVVTFTSVGYGDLTPSTLPGKMFTCFFGLSGLAFLGAAISTIGSSLLGKQEEFIKATEKASRNRMKNIFEDMPQVVKSLRTSVDGNASVTRTTSTDDKQPTTMKQAPVGWRATAQKTVLKLLPAMSFLWFGGMVMARIEGWKWTDSIYYSIITGSTIGFGDFFPKTPLGRTWGIFFIPLAVAAAGDVLGNVGSSLVERRQAKVFKELMNREITVENLLIMDEDDNGKVSREEYVRFMLTEMGLVESEEYDELYDQFKRLDEDGSGYLDKTDLQLMAKHRAAMTSTAQQDR